jgi:hypothetical protein
VVRFWIDDFVIERFAAVLRFLATNLDDALMSALAVVPDDSGYPAGECVSDRAVLLSLVSAISSVLAKSRNVFGLAGQARERQTDESYGSNCRQRQRDGPSEIEAGTLAILLRWKAIGRAVAFESIPATHRPYEIRCSSIPQWIYISQFTAARQPQSRRSILTLVGGERAHLLISPRTVTYFSRDQLVKADHNTV